MTYWGWRCRSTHSWPRHLKEVSGQLQPWYPLNRRLGGPQSRSGPGEEERNSQPQPGIKPLNPNRPASRQSLYRLSFPGFGVKLFLFHLLTMKVSWSNLVAKKTVVGQQDYGVKMRIPFTRREKIVQLYLCWLVTEQALQTAHARKRVAF